MKKIWDFIKVWFGSFGADMLTTQGGELLKDSLEKFYEKHPKTCAAMVASMYVWIDTAMEDLAAKSKTDIDDKAVDEAKEELEAFAAAKGFTITNLDED